MTTLNSTHTCACGATIETHGWNNNYNRILRCDACEERRARLLADITAAIAGKQVETVYISNDVRDLVDANDLTVDYGFRKAEKMAGQLFQVVEA